MLVWELHPPLLKKFRILVVDDEKDVVYVIKKGLEQNGFKVDTFTDPREVVSKFKPDWYTLLILDIRMPGMSGIQLLRKITQMDHNVKVLFLTAFEIQEKEWHMLLPSTEVNGFIKKPIRIQQLMKAISAII